MDYQLLSENTRAELFDAFTKLAKKKDRYLVDFDLVVYWLDLERRDNAVRDLKRDFKQGGSLETLTLNFFKHPSEIGYERDVFIGLCRGVL